MLGPVTMKCLPLFVVSILIFSGFLGCLDSSDNSDSELDSSDNSDSELDNKPIATIVSINPNPAELNEEITFVGVGFSDSGYITDYEWGSSVDGILSNEKTFILSNLSLGNHTIFFKVQNDENVWSEKNETIITIKGKANRSPEALILMPRQSAIIVVGQPVTIGSASSDPDGDPLEYLWTLSGLGTTINLSTQASDTVVFDTPGNDLVLTLMVRDPGGLTGQDIVVISVESGNQPPTATITTPSNGGVYSDGSEVTFDGTASNDPDNDALSYNWDLGEVGGPTYTASKQSKFERELGEGNYTVTLTVEDPDGGSHAVTHNFSVINLPPVASIEADGTSVSTGESIQFSGEDSYDPEGDALDYLWDFDDNQTSSLKSPQHSWTEAGNYLVVLTVEDGNGKVGTATIVIEVN